MWEHLLSVRQLTSVWYWTWLYLMVSVSITSADTSLLQKFLTIKTCGEPKIENSMMNVTVKPGEMAQFKCLVDMSCIVATIEWYHDMPNGSQTKIKTARTSGDPHVHTIRKVSPLHEGLYTCEAGNVMGKAMASAYLEVSGATKSQQGLADYLLLLVSLTLIIRNPLAWEDSGPAARATIV